jgi:hypothetical protein|tara:strand:+ start:6011 stop:6199 length:189 start_codon:yes stop_codon:yes gene_type:complete
VCCTKCPHGKRNDTCAACKKARTGEPSSPQIEAEAEVKQEPEIKQEPFTIRGYFGFGDGDVR